MDWNSGFRAVLKDLFSERTEEVVRAYHKFEPAVESQKPHRLYREVLAATLQQAATSLGLPLAREKAESLPNRWGEQVVFGDVENMLADLRRLGCWLAVLTNCDEDLFAVTHRKFRLPFDLVVTAERVREYKPSLTHFRTFQDLSGVRPGEWIHVACSWFHDIAPAREIGIRSVWLDRDRTGHDPAAATVRIESATELPAVIKSLFGLR